MTTFDILLGFFGVHAQTKNNCCYDSDRSNQINLFVTHNTQKQNTQCIVNVVGRVANDPLVGYPVTKTIRTESKATHEIKNYYKGTQGT